MAAKEISSLPKNAGAYQQLVTGADGVAKWEDKPFGKMQTAETIFDEATATFTQMENGRISIYDPFGAGAVTFRKDESYRVIWDGVAYDVKPFGVSSGNFDCVGNASLAPNPAIGANNTGEPFFFYYEAQNHYTLHAATEGSHTVEVQILVDVVKQLPEEYIPITTTVFQGGNDDDHDHLYHVDVDTQEIGKIVTRDEFMAAFMRGPIYVNSTFGGMEPRAIKRVLITSGACKVETYLDVSYWTAEYDGSSAPA